MNIRVDALTADDWLDGRRIYAEGIAAGDATFELEPPGWEEWDASHRADCRLAARTDRGVLVGWAALSPVSDRCVYGGVGEVSVYVGSDSRGAGIGSKLLEGLVEASERAGVWTLQAGIFPENEASLRLHQNAGFRTVGIRKRVGRMGDRWRDVVLMERRSKVVGV